MKCYWLIFISTMPILMMTLAIQSYFAHDTFATIFLIVCLALFSVAYRVVSEILFAKNAWTREQMTKEEQEMASSKWKNANKLKIIIERMK